MIRCRMFSKQWKTGSGSYGFRCLDAIIAVLVPVIVTKVSLSSGRRRGSTTTICKVVWLLCACVAAVANGHAVEDTFGMTQKLRDERRLQAERVAQIELIRRQMEEEKERRRAIIAEVSLLRCHRCVAVQIRIQMLSESHSFFFANPKPCQRPV